MISFPRHIATLLLAAVASGLIGQAAFADNSSQQVAPNAKPADMKKPLQVFILLGQSNMVGMAQIGASGMTRFHTYVADKKGAEKGCTISVYKGAYDSKTDYDKQKPVQTEHVMVGYWPEKALPESSEQPCTKIARGFIHIKTKGIYSFKSGNIVEIDGKVIYRNEPKQVKINKHVQLDTGFHAIKIIYLDRGSNILAYHRWQIPGTLTYIVKQQGKFPFMQGKDGNWTTCNSVYYYDARTHHGSRLSPTSNNGHTFGPELGFGFVMGTVEQAPVLILKSCIGNRSLGWDLLPPGSKEEAYQGETDAGYHESPSHWKTGQKPADLMKDYKAQKGWWAGRQYDTDVANAKKALANLAKIDPQYKGQGYKIVGFVFWQGDKDSFSDTQSHYYEQNMVNFIKSIRKDFGTPKAPFAIATVGFYGSKMADNMLEICKAQLAVANAKKYPQFAGNVTTIDTRPFWHPAAESPMNQSYHYNHNADTYMHVGLRLGWAMADMLGKDSH